MIDISIDRCSWKSVAPVIASGEMSLRIVRMIAPRGSWSFLALVAVCQSVNQAASAFHPDASRKPAPTPSRPIASRRLNRSERGNLSVLIMRSFRLREP